MIFGSFYFRPGGIQQVITESVDTRRQTADLPLAVGVVAQLAGGARQEIKPDISLCFPVHMLKIIHRVLRLSKEIQHQMTPAGWIFFPNDRLPVVRYGGKPSRASDPHPGAAGF